MMIFLSMSIDSEWFQRYQELDLRAQSLVVDLNHFSQKEKTMLHHQEKGSHRQAAPPSEGCEGTVMLVRQHCKKGNDKSHCEHYLGAERAAFLASLFGNSQDKKWPVPSKIYASRDAARGLVEVDIVQNVAHKFDIVVNQDYDVSSMSKMAMTIVRDVKEGNMCGKLTLVAWRQTDISHLARHLGKYQNSTWERQGLDSLSASILTAL
jgi:hypothetical protein